MAFAPVVALAVDANDLVDNEGLEDFFDDVVAFEEVTPTLAVLVVTEKLAFISVTIGIGFVER